MSARKENESNNNNNKKVKEHAWKGAWNRPVKVDESSLDPLTVARMTDHNVRGVDEGEPSEERQPDEGGKVSPEEAIRIQSKDLP